MEFISQIFFAIILFTGIYFFFKKIRQILLNINLGKKDQLTTSLNEGFTRVLKNTFGHQIMFRNPLVGILHLIIFSGFLIINIEIIEIILDGLFGTHRIIQPFVGSAYTFIINCFEILAVAVIFVCVVFLYRRNIQKIGRFEKPELKGWPLQDANIILIAEIILMTLFLKMNAADQILQQRGVAPYINHNTGNFWISSMLSSLMNSFSTQTIFYTERACWWLHITGIIAFLNYLPYSKHLHIILAFPNAYYGGSIYRGKMKNMPSIQREVLLAFNPEAANNQMDLPANDRFGAKDVTDLSWKNLLDAYSCTECGRCTAACPANMTGKSLSPRKIMMDTRDRLEIAGKQLNQKTRIVEDGKSLLYDFITPEELMACTTCNACVEECPVSINPLDIILQLRRYLVMEESKAPGEWVSMYSNMETNFAPWKFSPEDRMNWNKD